MMFNDEFQYNAIIFDNLEYNNELTYRYDNSIFAFWFEALKAKSIFETSISFKENNRGNLINIL